MAHYLPLLLISVANNAANVSDDTHLETQPRGQVDYLSHNWDEEDVWRSWRNMTRQKNEIANGMRLENASWRTWWKQRNKLKTVSPETLNWLKDSDVTWLYGPLHTAVDWSPPPKPAPDPTSVDDKKPSSVHDRYDLQSSHPRQKPILKYRSISELLTSDLPSAISSPQREDDQHLPPIGEDGASSDEAGEQSDRDRRPSLPQTKSDTHLARWNNTGKTKREHLDALGFRKESPPRVVAEAPAIAHAETSSGSGSASGSASPSPDAGQPARRKSSKKRHITFNTFVEQCIAIDKPATPSASSDSSSSLTNITAAAPPSGPLQSRGWDGRTSGHRWAGHIDDEEDEDEGHRSSSSGSSSEDAYEPRTPLAPQASPYVPRRPQYPSSDEDGYEEVWDDTTTDDSESTSRGGDEEDDEMDDMIEMTSSRRRRNSGGPPPAASIKSRRSSQSTVVPRRRSSTKKGSVSSTRKGSTDSVKSSQARESLTIAHIAPTILKVGRDGFGVAPHGPGHRPYLDSSWMEGFGDEFDDENEYAQRWYEEAKRMQRLHDGDGRDESCGLVYVPRFLNSSPPQDSPGDEREEDVRLEDFSQEQTPNAEDIAKSSSSTPIPIVVRTPPTRVVATEDVQNPYDYFGGPDLGEDFGDFGGRRKGGYSRKRSSFDDIASVNSGSRTASSSSIVSEPIKEEDERGRSRSRSRSRTPSPAFSSPPMSHEQVPSPPSGEASLSPKIAAPVRGRLPDSTSRRSAGQHGSPLGSLSPEGIGSAYASGRSDARQSERDFGRGGGERRDGGQRGRERTERRLQHSTSPPSPPSSTSYSAPAPAGEDAIVGQAILQPSLGKNAEALNSSDIRRRQHVTLNNTTAMPTSSSPRINTTDASAGAPAPASPVSPSSPRRASGEPSHSRQSSSETGEDGTIVGRMVNGAKSYLSLWQRNADVAASNHPNGAPHAPSYSSS